MSASGAIVESAASGAGGASTYGAIVVSATSGVDAGAAAQQWQHRCGNLSQISSSGSLGDLGSGGGDERRARLSATNGAYAGAAAAAAYDWRAAVCVCVCAHMAGGAHTVDPAVPVLLVHVLCA